MATRKLFNLMRQGGMAMEPVIRQWFAHGAVQINGQVSTQTGEVALGDQVTVGGQHHYQVVSIPGGPRWYVEPVSPVPDKVRGAVRVHCGQHKCLTMYLRSVIGQTFSTPLSRRFTFTHFFGRLDQFYRYADKWTVGSISGHRIDLSKFDDLRVTRFIRDPRDLVVSSYFYHKRSAENWCGFKNLQAQDLSRVNGAVPTAIPKGESLAGYLNSCSLEEGLRAEIEFRRPHFESLLGWPGDDERIKVFRYEDIIGNEASVFCSMCKHFALPLPTSATAAYRAHTLRAAKRAKRNTHIRNASAGQWREYFSADLARFFAQEHGELLDLLGYPAT